MRVSPLTLVILGAIVALVALGVTDQVLPAADPRTAQLRPWIAARALGVTAYLLLAAEVSLGIILSHPRNQAVWHRTKQVFPWHEMLTVFTGAFLVLHIVLLAVDPFANVGWLGVFVPGLSSFRTPAVAVGTVAVYAMVITAVTAKWTRLLPSGWWLRLHRFAILTFLLVWIHGVLAGTDSGALAPLYITTGLVVLALVVHRLWTARVRPAPAPGPALAVAHATPAPAVEENR